ncbi:MAG: MipA/OmpV family protein [Parasulfuritortus sp.]|nr:MipA/OmpV family protein [Parasulfuritortus sp.]
MMRLRPPALILAALGLGCLHAMPASAAEKPLWELGAGVSALSFPDYRGSDRSDTYAMPFPYVVYRGEFLKADRNGIRGTFFNNDRIDLNVSVGASLPVKSSDNAARQGMPDLKPTVEIGPSLDLTMWRTDDHRYKLDLRLPVRTAITVDSSMQDIGWVFSPRLNLDVRDPLGLPGWNLGLLAGPMFGSARNHQYFYAVAPQYATADRPAYEARGGYAGSQFLMAVSKRYDRYWLGAFARWDTLKGAVFADSPLVKRDYYFAAGVGVAWVFGQSSKLVETDE